MAHRAPVIEFEFTRGDEFVGDTFTFRPDSTSEVTGVEFWDNYAVKAQMRATFDGDLIHEFSLAPAVTDDNGTGVLTLYLGATASQTQAFTPGNYVGDLEIKSDQMPKRTVAYFRFKVNPDVTHA